MHMQEGTAASVRHDHVTFRERANESVRCLEFWAKPLLTDRPTGLGPYLGMALAEGPSGHQLKIRHPSQLAVGVRDSDEWGLIESR